MFGKGAPRCRRCSGAVYAAEEIIGAGQKWHTQCFCCNTCKVRLSSTNLNDKDGEIYCSTCYAKQWGPKGFGIGSQSLTYTGVSVADGSNSSSSNIAQSPAKSSPPPAAAPASSPSGSAGRFCTNCGAAGQQGKFCGSCGKPIAGAAAASSPAAAAPAPAAVSSSPTAGVASGNFAPNAGAIQRPGFVSMPTSSNKCGACGSTVYEAEKVAGGGRVWHSSCFRCTSCRAGLSSTNLNDKDGKVYCTACYGKNFGPKGFGFAGGAAGLMSQ